MSLILEPNNNWKQRAFRRILNSAGCYGGIEITIAVPRRRVRIKADEIKMLPVSGMKKIEILKKYIDDDIHDPRVDKKRYYYIRGF